MSIDHSVVPTLTRADLLLIVQWTAANERARREYERDPFAGSRDQRAFGSDPRISGAGATSKTVRQWARAHGHHVSDVGVIPAEIVDAYLDHLEQI